MKHHWIICAAIGCACFGSAPSFAQTSESPATGGGNLKTAQEAIQAASTLRKAGKTTAAIKSLKTYLETASPEASVLPMLRLGYLYVLTGHKGMAKERFNRLAQIPEGMNDAARGEAALRMSYLTHDRERAMWAERIVAGNYKVTDDQLSKAYRLAAAEAHRRDDLRRAIELYQISPELQTTGSRRAYVFKELAGLYFEVGKGEGDIPVDESIRPDMFTQARSICEELAEMKGAPSEDRMVGGLMEAETWFFQGDYQTSYDHAKAFLTKYGDSPSKYKSHIKRKYVVTAKTLQMQNCYFIGLHDEAQAIAKHMLKYPPKARNHFKSSDSTLIGLEVMKLCANERGDQQAVGEYGTRAWQLRPDYLGTERKMQQRRAHWLARSGK